MADLVTRQLTLIPLTQGQSAIVDVDDYEWLMQWKWFADWSPFTKSFYAKRCEKRKSMRMHRVILGLNIGDGIHVDHINMNTLDNRRSNLRTATFAENMRNRAIRSDSRTGFKGVIRSNAKSTRWRAQIQVDGRILSLGVRDTPEEAHQLYVEASKKYHGGFSHA